MLAITHADYGPPATLELRNVPLPELRRPDGVLVRVHATALHVADSFAVRGTPWLVRLATGWWRPRCGVPGQDFAGVVVAVGPKVRSVRPGDMVCGIGDGTCAEFTTSDERRVSLSPSRLDPVTAAALPTAGLTALHGLRDAGRLQPGQRVLIHGAAGGVGTCAVQIAKAMGAEVTAVCSTRNVELVRSLGADHVVDYTRTDWTREERRYDLVLDNIEDRPLAACRRALTPTGTLVCNSGTGATGLPFLRRLLAPVVLAPFVRQRLRRLVSMPNATDLRLLCELVAAGTLTPVVERTYPLAQTVAALAHVESGRTRGRVVVVVAG